MNTQKPAPICGQHRIPKEWSLTTFEYDDEGILIRVPHVYAWVCPVCQDQSFTPETTDELIETVQELVEIAKHARQRRSVLTEYVVSVAA
jgi:YgiT-type zinc finger domain-containing protein